MNVYIYAPDPKLDELDKSFEREVRLERKLSSLKIIFGSLVLLAIFILALLYHPNPDLWIVRRYYTGMNLLLLLINLLLIQQTEKQINAEVAIQTSFRDPALNLPN